MEKHPIRTLLLSFLRLLLFFYVLSWFSDAGSTVKQEYQLSALLKKYSYFKDLSAAIDKKDADIAVYKEELSTPDPSIDKTYIQQRRVELLGIVSIRNQLCAEYNSAMSKENYAFCNVGSLPQSNLPVLPREYKPYTLTLK